MKRFGVVCLAVLLVVLLAGCTQMSAEEIAKKLEEKYNAVKDIKGLLRETTEGKNGKHVIECEYVFKKPNKFWMHDKSRGLLIVSNGEKMWIYNEKKNKVTVTNITMPIYEMNPDYGEIIKDMLKRYDVKLLGSEKVSDRDCYVVQLTPKNGENVEIKMWVDKEFWYPLKIEYRMGEIKSTAEYLNVEFNTGVSDDLFQFTPPKGAKVKTGNLGIKKFDSVEEAQKHVDFRILKPTYTAGYELKSVTVMSNSVILMYAKDDKMLMINEDKGEKPSKIPNAEKVKVGDSEGLYAEIYGSNILVFKKGDIVVTITGKMDKEELIKIAESME